MSTNRKNMYPGICGTCGCQVAAGAGVIPGRTAGGIWTIACAEHAPRPAPVRRFVDDDDGYDAIKDGAMVAYGTTRRWR